MNKILREKLSQYADSYYNRSRVEEIATSGVIRIYVPEADQQFLLGLGMYNVKIMKIVPSPQHMIRISVMEMKD